IFFGRSARTADTDDAGPRPSGRGAVMSRHVWLIIPALLLVSGCLYPVQQHIDTTVCDLAALPRDLQPLGAADQNLPSPVKPPAYQETKPGKPGVPKRLEIPDELHPGGKKPPIDLPP